MAGNRRLSGKRVAMLAADMVEQVELTEPRQAVEEAGATVELLSIHDGEIQGFNHFEPADTFKVDKLVGDASSTTTTACSCPAASATLTSCAATRRRSPSCATSPSREADGRDLPRRRGSSSRPESPRADA